MYMCTHTYVQASQNATQLTPVASESTFFVLPSYDPPPPPPPPNYPAPEISTADLNIGPNLRTFPSSYNADVLSGLSSSARAATVGTSMTGSSPPLKRSSAVVNNASTPHKLYKRQSTIKQEVLSAAADFADSFEDTFEQTIQANQWSSFDDMEGDESYV